MHNWNPIPGETFQWAQLFNDQSRRKDEPDSRAIPQLRDSAQIVVFSDFGAHRSGVRRDVVSFVFTNDANRRQWDAIRSSWRAQSMPDTRRMKFSSLNDKDRRSGALAPFLAAADQLPGLLATFVVDLSVGSLFAERGNLPRRSRPGPQ